MLINEKFQSFRTLNLLQVEAIKAFSLDPLIKYDYLSSCPLCLSPERNQIANKDQFGINLQTVCCSNCGLLYSVNQLTDKSTEVFYDKYYRRIYEGVSQATLEHKYYKKLYSGWVPRIPSFIDKSKTVVEIGCGGGWNLLPYHKRGIRHIGFDFDSDMVSYGRDNYGLNLYVGGLNEALNMASSIDFLILSQVVEHLKDPCDFLNSLRSLFSVSSLISINVPSIDYMEFLGGNSTHYDLEHNLQNAHNFTFCEQTLSHILLKAGYRPILILGGYALAFANSGSKQGQCAIKTTSVNNTIFSNMMHRVTKIQKWKIQKQRFSKLAPSIIWNIAYRSFYFANAFKTMRYFYLTYILKRWPR